MERRRLTSNQARLLDVVIAVGTGAFGVWRELHQRPGVDRLVELPIGAYVAIQLVAAALLLQRRQRPLGVGVLTAALCLLTPVQPPVVIAYAIAAHAVDRRRAALTIGLVIVGWCVGAQVWQLEDPVSGPLAIAFGILLGLYVRARRTLYDALLERAERAEREQELLAAQAVAQERARLASEMHDVLSHRLSLMLLQAGAMSVSSTDPEVRRSVEELRSNGLAALTELRDVFGSLHRSDAGRESAVDRSGETGASAVRDVLATWQKAGGTAHLTEVGSPTVLSPVIGRTVHRIVQESLTNIGKHARGAAADIRIEYTDQGATVVITNPAPAAPPDDRLRRSGAGSGLIGLQQRVELVGGELTAGPDGASGFRVEAWLPPDVPAGRST